MSPLQTASLAVLQGVTEFLPISSSGHLVLARWLLRWPDTGLAFDVALHMGTLVAVLAYFARDWARLARALLRSPRSGESRLAWMLALATLPGAVAGAFLQGPVEGFFRHPAPIAVLLVLTGAVLVVAPLLARRPRAMDGLTVSDALLVGVAQAAAILPGLSRSGTTMAAGRALGLSAEAATRFSFLLAVPIMAGAGFYEGLQIVRAPQGVDLGEMALGALIAGVVGFLSIAWLLGIVRRVGFTPFAIYCFAAGGAVLAAVALTGL